MPSALSTFGVRVGRHAGVYGAGAALSIVLGLVNLAVLTRFLPPAEFGGYALYVAFSALLAMVYNLGSLKGGIRATFGGDDDDDDDEEEEEGDEREPAGDRRRALGTALTLTALIGGAGTILVWALAPVLAGTVLGDSAQSATILVAAGAGALAAVWRLASNVPRRERRPGTYVGLQVARPLLVLAVTVPLVASGAGVYGAVVGLAAGTAAALAVSLVAIRRSWVPAFHRGDIRIIGLRGAPYVPLSISAWVIQNAGLFVLAGYAPPAQVGLLRLAGSFGLLGAQAVTAYLRASGPLTREPIHVAVRRERGPEQIATIMTTYFGLASLGMLLVFALASDVLVRIAPPSYSAAAELIPILVLAFVLNGWFRVVYRAARGIPGSKRAWKVGGNVLAALVFLGAVFVLAPRFGAIGVAWAMVIGFAAAAVTILVRSQTGPKPIRFARRKLAAAVVLAVTCYLAARLLEGLAGPLAPVVAGAAILAYPVLLVATGVIPRWHVRPLRDVSVATVSRRRSDANGSVALRRLDAAERQVLELLVREGRPPNEVVAALGETEEALARRFVAALRRAGRVGKPTADDARIGAYLLSQESVADRDQHWRRLAADGVDPLDTDALTIALERLRRAPAAAWRAS